jgi:hypothetical protein
MTTEVFYLLVKDWEVILICCSVVRETKAMYFLASGEKRAMFSNKPAYGVNSQLHKGSKNVFVNREEAVLAYKAVLLSRVAKNERENDRLRLQLAQIEGTA